MELLQQEVQLMLTKPRDAMLDIYSGQSTVGNLAYVLLHLIALFECFPHTVVRTASRLSVIN